MSDNRTRSTRIIDTTASITARIERLFDRLYGRV